LALYQIIEFQWFEENQSKLLNNPGLGLKDRKYFANSILKPLVKGNLLNLTMADKPTSPNQKYHSDR